MTNILNIIKKNKSTILFLIIGILIILYMKECSRANYEQELNKQNFAALNEGMTVIKQKNGELINQKAIFVGELNEIKKYNKDLYDAIEELKNSGIKTQTIIKTEYKFIDSGNVQNKLKHIYGDKYSLDFSYKDSSGIIQIDGKSNFFARSYIKEITKDGKYNLGVDISADSTKFDQIVFKSGFILGIGKDKDGIERVTVKTNPYSDKIKIENIESAEIEKYFKKKYNKNNKINLGPSVGYGVMLGGNGQVNHGPYIGINATYRIIGF